MAHVLVVDEHRVERDQMLNLLSASGYQCQAVNAGGEALAALEKSRIDAVLTELQLPDINGLQLVERIRDCHPRVSTLLVTGQGDEDVAVEALQKGACGYLPKRRIERDLVKTLQNILGLQTARSRFQHLTRCWIREESQFSIGNSAELIPPLVAHLQEKLRAVQFGDESMLMRVGVAMTEALENAVYHGNLELSSELRKGDGRFWMQELQHRRHLAPYCDRNVDVAVTLTRETISVKIRDEGPGFDPHKVPDPTAHENLLEVSGRGLHLIRMLMDGVEHNQRGNEIRLIKHRQFPADLC